MKRFGEVGQRPSAGREPTHYSPFRASSNRGQLGPLGVVIILGIVVIGMVAIVMVGGQALADSRQQSELNRAENTLLQLDSRASLVALGESDLQSLSLGATGDGQWDVVEDAAHVTITHHNYTEGESQVIYDDTLGTLVYRNGDATVAYQAGGVWRSDDGVTSVMLSPPEFHYREETLVFPIIDINGDDSVAGTSRATLAGAATRTKSFPNPDRSYDEVDRVFENPIRGGSVTVTIQSDYYQAWARFFEKRSGGEITVDHETRQVTVELSAPRFIGAFEMPNEGDYIPIRGITDGHALETFTIDLAPDNTDAARFNNLQWSLRINEGAKELELHLKLRNADNDPATLCKEQSIAATLYYSDDNGNTYQGWKNPDAFRTTCVDRDDDGLEDEVHLAANLTGSTPLYMTDLEQDDLLYLTAKGDQQTNITFDEHDSVLWEPRTYTEGGTDHEQIGNLMKHYFALLGEDYDIYVTDKNSDTIHEDNSTGVLEYGSRGKVTYMHVTTEELQVTLRK